MITITLEQVKNKLEGKLEAGALSDEYLYDIIAYSIDIVASDARRFKKDKLLLMPMAYITAHPISELYVSIQ